MARRYGMLPFQNILKAQAWVDSHVQNAACSVLFHGYSKPGIHRAIFHAPDYNARRFTSEWQFQPKERSDA